VLGLHSTTQVVSRLHATDVVYKLALKGDFFMLRKTRLKLTSMINRRLWTVTKQKYVQ
jgi:hypothetical protein